MDESIADIVFRATHPDVGVVIFSDHVTYDADQDIQTLEDIIDSAIHDEIAQEARRR